MRAVIRLLICANIVACVGCSSQLKTAQLQGVAKDWSQTIRACQILPVYPLTQDLQPGDVLLVHQTADEEVESYNSSGGYLPLTQIVARLPVNYADFYMKPPVSISGSDFKQPGVIFPTTQPDDLPGVPRASFPSFSFDVSDQEGASASFPVHGIPVGLSLIGSGSAHGQISFTGTYTYGLGTENLDVLMQKYALDNKEYITKIATNVQEKGTSLLPFIYSVTDKPTYLRVISRVYMVTDVNVTLTATGNGGAGASVGIPKALDLSQTDSGTVQQKVNAINDAIKSSSNAGIGGSTTLAFATGRSVSMNDHFDKPLVIGYLAVDYEIDPDSGKLRTPLPTIYRLNEKLSGRSVQTTAAK